MVKKVMMKPRPDSILLVVLKNCEPELSHKLAELFNMCLEEYCFPDYWRVSSVVPVLKNIGEGSTAKNYCPVSLVSVVSKVFEKLLNKRIVDHLQICGLSSDFQYGLGSSQSTSDLLTVISPDRIARAFNSSGATRDVAIDVLKAFIRLGMLVFFRNLSVMEFQVRFLVLFLLFPIIGGFGWFWMGNLHENIQLILEFLKSPFLVHSYTFPTIHE